MFRMSLAFDVIGDISFDLKYEEYNIFLILIWNRKYIL